MSLHKFKKQKIEDQEAEAMKQGAWERLENFIWEDDGILIGIAAAIIFFAVMYFGYHLAKFLGI